MTEKKQKILVTGAAGFIGFHLVKSLLERGDTVVGLDNINDYYDVNLKYARLSETGISKKAEKWYLPVQSSKFSKYYFIRMNLEDKEELFKLFDKEKFDLVVNLAAQAGVRYSIDNPDIYIQSNIVGFFNILEACRYNEIKHLVFASSSSVYGNNTKIPLSTSDRVDHPISLYAATKKSNELMAYTYSHLYGISSTGLRFFTVYGPWGRPDMAPFIFTKSIIENKTIKVFNYGKMVRDFTYIDDIIEGVVRVIDSPPKINENGHSRLKITKEAPYKLYNIGNSSPVQLMDFINTIEKKLGKKAKKELYPIQPGDVVHTEADVEDLIRDIGYKPSTGIDEGIEKFVTWYNGYYNFD